MNKHRFLYSVLLFFYRIIYGLVFLAILPKLLWVRVVQGKRQHIRRRLFPKIRFPVPGAGPLVWVHAVSVGEVYAVAPVVKALLRENPSFRIVLSTVTQTGHEAGKKAISEAEVHVFLPFDFRFSIRRSLRMGTPDLVIFSEGDLWPLFLHEVKRGGASVVVVNAKISDRTASRYRKVPAIARWLYSYVDIMCVQNQTFYDRCVALGVPRESVHVTGNTKADITVPLLPIPEIEALRSELGLDIKDRLIVVASTHFPEEEELVARLLPLIDIYPEIKIAVVPRHPERFSEVFRCIQQKTRSTVLMSSYRGEAPWNVMVVDRHGVLTKLYQVATVAIVGGSFTERIGGHNILEPAAVHVPVVVGPHMHSQPTFFQSARAADAVIQVSYDTVAEAVDSLLNNEKIRKERAERSFQWANSLRGATDATLKILLEKVRQDHPTSFSMPSCRKIP
jgi:3-deoxy-D-manno-octulosonic-acid transferase